MARHNDGQGTKLDLDSDARAIICCRSEKRSLGRSIQPQVNAEDLSLDQVWSLARELKDQQISLKLKYAKLLRDREQLNASRNEYFDLYENAPVGYVTMQANGLILEANCTFTQLANVEFSDLKNQPFFYWVHGDDRDIVDNFLRLLFATGNPQSCELRLVKSDGETCWIRLDANRTQAVEGQSVARIVVTDIDQLKQSKMSQRQQSVIQTAILKIAEAALADTSMQVLFEEIHQILSRLMLVENFTITTYDEEADEIVYRYRVSENNAFPERRPAGKGLTEHVMKLGRAVYLNLADLTRLKALGEDDLSYVKISGWLGAPLINTAGKSIGAMALFSERETHQEPPLTTEGFAIIAAQVSMAIERTQERLARKEGELAYSSLVHNLTNGIIVRDSQDRITFANAAIAKMIQVEQPEGLVGRKYQEFFQSVGQKGKDIQQTGIVPVCGPSVREHRLAGVRGDEVFVESFCVPITQGGQPFIMEVFYDITDRKKAEDSLRRYANIQFVLREITEGIVVAPDLGELYAMVHRLTGQLLPAQNFSIVLSDESGREIVSGYFVDENNIKFSRRAVGKGLTEYVMRLGRTVLLNSKDLNKLRESGDFFPRHDQICQYMGAPLVNPNGTPFGVIAILLKDKSHKFNRDDVQVLSIIAAQVSMAIKRKRDEESLRKREAHFRHFVENSSHLLFSVRLDGTVEYVSPQFKKMTDYDVREIIGQPLSLFIHPDDHLRVQAQFTQANVDRIDKFETEYRFWHKSGEWRWHNASVSIMRDRNGAATSFFGIANDIFELKKVVDARRESAIMFLNLLQNVPSVAIQGYDENGIVNYWNQTSERIYGYTAQEALGENIVDLIVARENRKRALKAIRQIVETGQSIRATECRFMRKDGVRLAVFASITVIKIPDRPTTLFCVGFDMTEQKRVEKDLADLCQKAEEASKAKSRFLTNMSHELRTPLNAIIGFSEVLKDQLFGPLNKKQEKYVGDVLSSAQHLLSLVTDILDLSKVESGKMTLEKGRINIKEVAQGTLALFRQKAAKRGVTLTCNLDPSIEGLRMLADGRKIKQILYNLIDNGIKFNKQGGSLGITVHKIAWGEGAGAIRIVVEDSGVGIPAGSMELLFKPFSQLSRSYTEQVEGTGLGLALTKHLVELHGGKITVESEVDKGSRFVVFIPTQEEKV